MNERSGLNLRGNPSLVETHKVLKGLSQKKDSKLDASTSSFGILLYVLIVIFLDEIVKSNDFYNYVLSLQKLFASDLSFIVQSYDDNGKHEHELWNEFSHVSELLIKLSNSKDFIDLLNSKKSESTEKPFNTPWRYTYSQSLFIHEASSQK